MQTEMMKPSRPDGVNLLAVLSILLATFLVTGGVVELIWPNPAIPGTSTDGVSGAFIIGVGIFALTFGLFWVTTDSATIGIVVLILAVVYIFVGAGFLTRRNRSRLLGIDVTALPIILGIGQIALNPLNLRAAALNIVGMIFFLIIIYYLTRPYVKAYFGKKSTIQRTTESPQPSQT